MAPTRILIADDEPLVRSGLRRVLAHQTDVEIMAECRDGAEAVEAILRERPDIVFLDVQMPELTGFEVLESLEPEQTPLVVFVTAFDEYALAAFDVHAVDYVLKPFDDERVIAALQRARERLATGARHDDVTRLLGSVRGSGNYLERVVAKNRGRIVIIPVGNIERVESADNYVRVFAEGEVHLVRHTIKGLATRLDPRQFARIHRSTVVNITKIRELRPQPSGDYTVHLASGARVTLSRTFKQGLEEALGWTF